MTAVVLPPGKQTFVGPDGVPLAGGKVYHYTPGTLVKKDTWQDYGQAALNTNPIVLDLNGQAVIFGVGNYRQRVEDSAGNEIWDRNTTTGVLTDITFASSAIFGLTLANSGASPTTKIDVAAGQCRDSTNSVDLNLAGGLTKDLTAVWAVGTGNGGRDAATALAAKQTWHVHLIYNPDTLVVDALFSQSPTNPSLPNGYTKFRRLGSIILQPASTSIMKFVQDGDRFMLVTRSVDFAGQANAGGPFLRTFTVPAGVRVRGIFYFQSTGGFDAPYLSGLYDPQQGVPAAFGPSTQWAQIRRVPMKSADGSNGSYGAVICEQFLDTSARLWTYSNDAIDIIAVGVIGWVDPRTAGA